MKQTHEQNTEHNKDMMKTHLREANQHKGRAYLNLELGHRF